MQQLGIGGNLELSSETWVQLHSAVPLEALGVRKIHLLICCGAFYDAEILMNYLHPFQAQATRERPRTGSQTNSTSVPVSVAPPPGQAQPVARQAVAQPAPAPQAKPPSIDLLSDLGGDPFDQTQMQG